MREPAGRPGAGGPAAGRPRTLTGGAAEGADRFTDRASDVVSPASGVLSRLREFGVVPVLVIEDPAAAVPLGAALVAGGLPCAEVTFRTPGAAEALARMAGECPELLVGAGTVLEPAQVVRAHEAGAHFVVSPGFNPRVADACRERDLAVYPGVCTPTEIEMALERGLDVLKFFPAEPIGGLGYLKAIAAPYPGIEFIPTGGIRAGHLPGYLGFERVVACGGSWMAPAEWIRAGAFERIRHEVENAVETVRRVRAAR